jgi:hypothetical protein
MSAIRRQHARAIAARDAIIATILVFRRGPEEPLTTVLGRVPVDLYRRYERALINIWITQRVAIERGLARSDGRGDLIWNRRRA